jgi:hypothetical protein
LTITHQGLAWHLSSTDHRCRYYWLVLGSENLQVIPIQT